MAVIYYSGNQRSRAVEYAPTVTAIASTQTITATINGKAEVYVSDTADATTAAAAASSQFSASLLLELQNFTFGSDGAVITAVGPATGAPVAITFSSTGTLSGAAATVTALSPSNVSDAANFVGGVAPVNGDTLVIENTAVDLLYGLSTYAANTILFVRRASHAGVVGLPDTNPLGYPEYLPTHFETAGVTLTVEDGGQGFVRIKSAAGSAVTASISGNGPGTLGNENVEIFGTPASSVINLNGGSLAFCPTGSQTGTAATIRCANAALRIGGGATVTAATAQSSQVSSASTITTYTQDRGTTTTFGRAAGGTTLNIEDGTFAHNSTGGWTTVNINSGGTYDVSFAPTTVAITTINLAEDGTLLDPNERIVQPYALNINGELENVSMDLGTTVALTVG